MANLENIGFGVGGYATAGLTTWAASQLDIHVSGYPINVAWATVSAFGAGILSFWYGSERYMAAGMGYTLGALNFVTEDLVKGVGA